MGAEDKYATYVFSMASPFHGPLGTCTLPGAPAAELTATAGSVWRTAAMVWAQDGSVKIASSVSVAAFVPRQSSTG